MPKKKDFIDCFCEFMGDTDGMTKEEVEAELKEMGVDTDKLEKRVSKIVKEGISKRKKDAEKP